MIASQSRSMEECVHNNNDEHVYDPSILANLSLAEWSASKLSCGPTLSSGSLRDGLVVRPLKRLDFNKGYLELLAQLTVIGDVSEEKFLHAFSKMKKCPDSYFVTVIEDMNTGTIVGNGTLFIEQKFIRGCAKRGRIEDVVVSDKHRGKQLGKLLIAILTVLAKDLECYKVSLDCNDKMIPFYGSLGYEIEEGNSSSMKIRF